MTSEIIEKIVKEIASGNKFMQDFIPARKNKPEQMQYLIRWLELRSVKGKVKARLHGTDLGELTPEAVERVEEAFTQRTNKPFSF